VQPLLDLRAQLALGVAAVALLLGLAHAQDRREALLERHGHLVLQRAVGLAVELAALGVARGSRPCVPTSSSMPPDTSPVYGPPSDSCMFCA
jgi:hypothetical protein